MGDRLQGIAGDDPPPPGVIIKSFGPIDTGFDQPGPVGLDGGSGVPAGSALQLNGWPRSISWSEFTDISSRPSGIDEDAQIHSDVDQPQRVAVARENGLFRVSALTVSLSIVSDDTWVVTAQKSADLLSHEQGHYDITGLMGRDMGNEILAARSRTVNELQNQVTSIIEKYRQRAKTLTTQYDKESDHSQNRDGQKRWDERIKNATQSGARFTAP
jgi:hypothetical protein